MIGSIKIINLVIKEYFCIRAPKDIVILIQCLNFLILIYTFVTLELNNICECVFLQTAFLFVE